MTTPSAVSHADAADALSLQERRSWIRFPCPPGMTGRVTLGADQPAQLAHILNISGGSIGFLLDDPTSSGTLLQVELERGRARHRLQARVVRATLRNGRWLYGCELLTPLSVKELVDLLGAE